MKLSHTAYVTGEVFFLIRTEIAVWLSSHHVTAELHIKPIRNTVRLTFGSDNDFVSFQQYFEGRL